MCDVDELCPPFLNSTSEDSCDSDKIDSDIEAELYSSIHHGSTSNSFDLSRISNISNSFKLSPKVFPKNIMLVESEFNIINLPLKDGTDGLDSFSAQTGVSSYTQESDVAESESHSNLENDMESSTISLRKPDSEIRQYKRKLKSNNKDILRKKQKVTSSQVLSRHESSDSDSIVWSGEDDVQCLKIQTNLEPELVALSSESNSEDSSAELKKACSFKGVARNLQMSAPSSSVNEPWNINYDDLFRDKRRTKRYHGGSHVLLKCISCKQSGHTFKFCSVPKATKCFICGYDHRGSKCKDQVCGKCYETGHESRYCSRRLEKCNICQMKGHAAKFCPDLWRRYHATTTPGPIITPDTPVQNPSSFCCNCGEEGHYSNYCRVAYSDHYNFPMQLCVVSYDHPHETMKKIMDKTFENPSYLSVVNNQHQQLSVNMLQKRIQNKKKKETFKKKKTLLTPQIDVKPDCNHFSFPRTPKSQQQRKQKRRKNFDVSMNGSYQSIKSSPGTSRCNKFVKIKR